MAIKTHPRAKERMQERGVTEEEVIKTVEMGERFSTKFGRTGFKQNFSFGGMWKGRKNYESKL